MASKIKGGGRAIMSQESQQAIIDLLMSLDDEGRDEVELSAHEKKRQRKKFMKRLIGRREQRQLQQKFNAAPNNNDVNNEGASGNSSSRNATSLPTQICSESTSPNVRVELVEAIFSKSDKKDTKKKSSKDKKKKSDKKSKKSSGNGAELFTAGAKKVIVLPRATTIPELLKKSKTKLKLKKNPLRVFVQLGESSPSTLFDLDHDLSGIEDGATVYVSVTPPTTTHADSMKDDNSGDDENDISNEEGIDPLDSVKRAYQKQEVYRRPPQLQRVDEIIDEKKKKSFEDIRAKLPVSAHKQQICEAMSDSQVVVLSGATGSGKSTQVPQFLLDGPHRDFKRPYIVVTQPRKVAAISLAHRVADERGCPPPGEAGSSVGYMVRLDRRVDLRSCRIVYMTIGILLRMLVNRAGGPSEGGDDSVAPPLSIETISHLIIDETHERDVTCDFSLTLLKGMLSSQSCPYVPRLILMSATASSELFLQYFSTKVVLPVSIEVPGKTFPVESRWASDCEKYTGESMMNRGKDGRSKPKNQQVDGDNVKASSNNTACQLSPRASEKIDNQFIRSLIVTIVKEQQSEGMLDDSSNGACRATGAILVFLPGLGEIESLARCLNEKGAFTSDRSLCRIKKLHSSIPKAEQRYVFQPASSGTVKIVLATNIAETSVTISDVSHVIDTCQVKESRYNPSTRIKELVTVWTSHASMKQRAGRAGRTSAGVCWRLCSEEFARNELMPHTVPEMLRTPLDELILQIGLLFEQRRGESESNSQQMASGFKPLKFLSLTPTPPAEQSLTQACKHLMEVEALKVVHSGREQIDWMYRLTPLGYHLSKLPMDAKVGKMLIVGCVLGCLDNALTIAAALSCTKSCFLPIFRAKNRQLDQTYTEARNFLIETGFGGKDWPGGTVKGDLIAVIAAYRAWIKEKKSYKFCTNRALDIISLREMDRLREQFRDLIIDAGLVSRSEGKQSLEFDDCNIANEDALLTSCCIVGGLYPNVCTLARPRKGSGPKGGRLLTSESNSSCRPSSSSFQRRRVQQASDAGSDAYAVFYSKHRSMGIVSAGQKRPPETFLSEVNFVSKFALLLFGGEPELVKNAIVLDKWLKFKVGSDEGSAAQNATLIMSLRELLDKVILEHVVETFSPLEEKAKTVERHKRIIEVVRRVLADEG